MTLCYQIVMLWPWSFPDNHLFGWLLSHAGQYSEE